MSRIRNQSHGVIHDIHSRTVGLATRMYKKKYRDLFFDVVAMAQDKYHFELLSLIVMPNHFHIMIKTNGDDVTISRIMQFIKSVFARKLNKMTGGFGAVWSERFRNTVITDQVVFLQKLMKQAHDPVRSGFVTDPRFYEYGTINAYLDVNYKSMLRVTLHEFYLELGNTPEERIEAFLVYEKAYF